MAAMLATRIIVSAVPIILFLVRACMSVLLMETPKAVGVSPASIAWYTASHKWPLIILFYDTRKLFRKCEDVICVLLELLE